MIDTVCTYYEPVPDIDRSTQEKEIAIWRDSWKRWGWKVEVLGRQDVQIMEQELDRLRRLPSVNPPGYDLACYLRWFAMRSRGGGLLVDYDAINLRLAPADVPTELAGAPIVSMAPGGVPCAVMLSAGGSAIWCCCMTGYEPIPQDLYEGIPHVSDQTIVQRGTVPGIVEWPVCREPQDLRPDTRLLHVSHNAMATMGLNDWYRHDVMRVLAGLGAGSDRR